MTTQTADWKSGIGDLRARAAAVATSCADARMSARAAARCLSGVVGLVVTRWSVDVMQRACADLVRCQASWDTSFGTLPRYKEGVPEPIQLIAVVARGILPIAGIENMRAALSFWATEDDPAQWQAVVAGVAP